MAEKAGLPIRKRQQAADVASRLSSSFESKAKEVAGPEHWRDLGEGLRHSPPGVKLPGKKKLSGVGSSIKQFLTNPATIGAASGGLLGGGLGYVSADQPENRARGALIGAGTGAAIGGLAGGLSVPEKVTVQRPQIKNALEELAQAKREGYQAGQRSQAVAVARVAQHKGGLSVQDIENMLDAMKLG